MPSPISSSSLAATAAQITANTSPASSRAGSPQLSHRSVANSLERAINTTVPLPERQSSGGLRGLLSRIGGAVVAAFRGIGNVLTFRSCRDASAEASPTRSAPHGGYVNHAFSAIDLSAMEQTKAGEVPQLGCALAALDILSNHLTTLGQPSDPAQQARLISEGNEGDQAREGVAKAYRTLMASAVDILKNTHHAWEVGSDPEAAKALVVTAKVGEIEIAKLEEALKAPQFYEVADNYKALSDYIAQVAGITAGALDAYFGTRAVDPALNATAAQTMGSHQDALRQVIAEHKLVVCTPDAVLVGHGKNAKGEATYTEVKSPVPEAAAKLLRTLGASDCPVGHYAQIADATDNYIGKEGLVHVIGNRFKDIALGKETVLQLPDGRLYAANRLVVPGNGNQSPNVHAARTNYPVEGALPDYFKLLGQLAQESDNKAHVNILASADDIAKSQHSSSPLPAWFKQTGPKSYGDVTVTSKALPPPLQIGNLSVKRYEVTVGIAGQPSYTLTVDHTDNWVDHGGVGVSDLMSLAGMESDRYDQGLQTLTQCRAGVGRTGTLTAAALFMHHGGAFSMEELIQLNREQVTPKFVQTAAQVVALAGVENQYRQQLEGHIYENVGARPASTEGIYANVRPDVIAHDVGTQPATDANNATAPDSVYASVNVKAGRAATRGGYENVTINGQEGVVISTPISSVPRRDVPPAIPARAPITQAATDNQVPFLKELGDVLSERLATTVESSVKRSVADAIKAFQQQAPRTTTFVTVKDFKPQRNRTP